MIRNNKSHDRSRMKFLLMKKLSLKKNDAKQ